MGEADRGTKTLVSGGGGGGGGGYEDDDDDSDGMVITLRGDDSRIC